MGCKCDNNGFLSRATARVVLQSPSYTDDGYGGRIETYQDAPAVWAIVEPMAGREIYVSAQVQSRVDARITIRYQSTLKDTTQAAKLRIKNGARLYNIQSVRNLADDMKTEGTAYQQLLCTEGAPA